MPSVLVRRWFTALLVTALLAWPAQAWRGWSGTADPADFLLGSICHSAGAPPGSDTPGSPPTSPLHCVLCVVPLAWAGPAALPGLALQIGRAHV